MTMKRLIVASTTIAALAACALPLPTNAEDTAPTSTIASIAGPADVGLPPAPLPPAGPLCDPSWEQCGEGFPPVPTTTITPGIAGTSTVGRCTQYEDLVTRFAPPKGWDVQRMSKILWRESRCNPAAFSRTKDSGLAQINPVTYPYLRKTMGEWVDRWTLTDPAQNVRAAATLCQFWTSHRKSCYVPWGYRK